jgi:hypothetical protein
MRLLRLEAGLGKLGILVAEANDERLLVAGGISHPEVIRYQKLQIRFFPVF